MKAITLLFLGVINSKQIVFNSEVQDALENLDDEMETEVEEQNGLPYTNRSIKDAYFLQLNSQSLSGTNNSILLEA